ncbi:MAG: hypothetical protein WCR52_09775 [Bacteroidota bacterium]
MNRFRIVGLLCLILGLLPALNAQKLADLKKSGEKYFANAHWQEARQYLSQYQDQKPGDLVVLTKLGIALCQLHQADQGLKYLEYVLKQNPNSTDPELYYNLARALHGKQEYEKAIVYYKSFLRVCGERHPLRASIPDQIRRCLSGLTVTTNETVALVENMGDRINTEGDEYAPVASVNHADRIYFAAAKPGCTGGLRNDAGLEDEDAGHWCADMFVGELKPSGWELAAPLGSLLNTARHEAPLGFNENGYILYYFRGFTLYSGEILNDTAGRKDEYAVQSPKFKSSMRPEEGDGSPYFFNDTIMLFASRRPGGQGGLDLYLSILRDSIWSAPENLGPAVNSAYDETTPFLARDGRSLYFSSNNTSGIGGLDVYKAVFDDAKQAWQTPVNMGLPINSPGDDAFFRLASDGSTGIFASDRLDSYGKRDLYIAYFKDIQSEQTIEHQPIIYAKVGKTGQGSGAQTAVQTTETVQIPSLGYDSDRDISSGDNLKAIEQIATTALKYPSTNFCITVHTDETGPARFDLYNGIKRAEIVGKMLSERGVAPERMILRSCGAAYPRARNVLDAAPNPAGQKLNRRIDIVPISADGTLPFEFKALQPEVPELMVAGAAQYFDEHTKGLFYKLEVAVTRQILNNEALSMFSDLMIESKSGSGSYRYTAGLFSQFAKASVLRTELLKQGFTDVQVVAYLNGIRISKPEAVGLIKKYPDLASFIKG